MSDATAASADVHDGGVRRAGRWLLGRWPSAVGVLVAAIAIWGAASGVDLAQLVLFLGLNYVVAEISRKRWMPWVGTIVIFVLVPLSQRLDPELLRPLVLWAAIAAVLLGVVFAIIRSGGEMALQTVAMLPFGAIAAIALYIDPTVGAYLVAVGLIAHGIWDIIHHRRDLVVLRSFAEFCTVLDMLAGIAVIWITLTASAG